MYGKSFESMYEGSLVGSGFHVWAVWNYIITKTHYSSVELNPKLVAFTLGGSDPEAEAKVREAIDILCAPDPESRTKEEGGRRLIKEGQFQYRVVNWEKYQGLKSAEALKEYNRVKQAEYRAKKKAGRGSPMRGEVAYTKALENGGQAAADAEMDRQQSTAEDSEYLPKEP